MNRPLLCLGAVLWLSVGGCAAKKAVVAAPPARPAQPAAKAFPPPPVSEQPAPEVELPPAPPQLAAPNVAENSLPKTLPPPRPAVRRRKKLPTAPVVAGAEPAPVPATAAPPPQLTEIISAEQRQRYESEFSQGVGRANSVLALAASKHLSVSQQEATARIQTFLAQAISARPSDLSTALQLARRADLLGQELLKTLR